MSAIIPQTVLALKGFSLVLENSAHCLPQGAGGGPILFTTGGPPRPQGGRGRQGWDPMVGPYGIRLQWREFWWRRLGPYGGTLWLGPYGGTLWWDPMVGPDVSIAIIVNIAIIAI